MKRRDLIQGALAFAAAAGAGRLAPPPPRYTPVDRNGDRWRVDALRDSVRMYAAEQRPIRFSYASIDSRDLAKPRGSEIPFSYTLTGEDGKPRTFSGSLIL